MKKNVRGKPRRMRRKSITISDSIKKCSVCLFIDGLLIEERECSADSAAY